MGFGVGKKALKASDAGSCPGVKDRHHPDFRDASDGDKFLCRIKLEVRVQKGINAEDAVCDVTHDAAVFFVLRDVARTHRAAGPGPQSEGSADDRRYTGRSGEPDWQSPVI